MNYEKELHIANYGTRRWVWFREVHTHRRKRDVCATQNYERELRLLIRMNGKTRSVRKRALRYKVNPQGGLTVAAKLKAVIDRRYSRTAMCNCGRLESAFRLGMQAALRILEDEGDAEKARRKIVEAVKNRDSRLPALDRAGTGLLPRRTAPVPDDGAGGWKL